MTVKDSWRPAMYGGFAGILVGSLLMIQGWTSPQPGLCALQFAAVLGGGIGSGLILAYGPVRTIAWVFGTNRCDASRKDIAKRAAFGFLVACLGAALFAALGRPEFRLVILMIAWFIFLLLILMAAGPRVCDKPKKRWCVTACETLAAMYGPFVVATVHTWLYDGHNTWLCFDFWKFVAVVPGGALVELASAAIRHQHPNLSQTMMFLVSGLLSLVMVVGITWLSVIARWMRWLLLPTVGILCAYAAIVMDAVMRM